MDKWKKKSMDKWKKKRYTDYLDRVRLDESLSHLKEMLSDAVLTDYSPRAYPIVNGLRGQHWYVRKEVK